MNIYKTAVEGCLKAGVTKILVADSHWNFTNLIADELHEAVTLVSGGPKPLSMMEGLDESFDAATFIGCHAIAETPKAVLAHTYTNRIRSVEINGQSVGELGLNAYLLDTIKCRCCLSQETWWRRMKRRR